jgi:hypothetical protein
MIYGEILGYLDGMNLTPFGIPDGPWAPVLYMAMSLAVGSILFSLLKGKYGIALLFFIIPGVGVILSCVGAVTLAKPRSFWARHLYDRKTMARAIERHEPPIDLEQYPEPKLRRGYTAPQPPVTSAE